MFMSRDLGFENTQIQRNVGLGITASLLFVENLSMRSQV
jgi:hypothetical protein